MLSLRDPEYTGDEHLITLGAGALGAPLLQFSDGQICGRPCRVGCWSRGSLNKPEIETSRCIRLQSIRVPVDPGCLQQAQCWGQRGVGEASRVLNWVARWGLGADRNVETRTRSFVLTLTTARHVTRVSFLKNKENGEGVCNFLLSGSVAIGSKRIPFSNQNWCTIRESLTLQTYPWIYWDTSISGISSLGLKSRIQLVPICPWICWTCRRTCLSALSWTPSWVLGWEAGPDARLRGASSSGSAPGSAGESTHHGVGAVSSGGGGRRS